MTVGIITNESKDEASRYTSEVTAFLQARDVQVFLGPSPEADFWVVLGGDGTMLRASHQAAVCQKPMLGINFGNLGFLTDVDKQDGFTALDKMLQGAYKREERLMLEMIPGGKLALNDVYISRGSFEKMIQFDVYINGQIMDSLRADGVLIATPTGSTAYNLSAGGPILMPDGNMMVITAVCPHNLHTRPWVISDRDEVGIVTHHTADISLDGETHMEIKAGDNIIIRRFALNTIILRTSGLHFYEILRRKMVH